MMLFLSPLTRFALFSFIFAAILSAQLTTPALPWTTVPGVRLFTHPANEELIVRIDNGEWSISQDGGKTATPITAPFANNEKVSIHFDVADEDIVVALQGREVQKLSVEAPSWEPLAVPEELRCESCPDIRFAIRNTGETTFLAGGAGGLWTGKMEEDGIAWERTLPTDEPVTALAVSADQERLAVGLASGTVHFKEEDAWRSFTPRPGEVSALAFRDEPTQALFVGYSGIASDSPSSQIFATFDNGFNYTSLQGNLPVSPVRQLYVQEGANEEPSVLFAVLADALYRSSEDGVWILEMPLESPNAPSMSRFQAGGNVALLMGDGSDSRIRAAAAAPCTFTITATAVEVPAAGGPFSVGITASAAGCRWTVVRPSSSSSVTLESATSGAGSTTVKYRMSANTGQTARTVSLKIAGRTAVVTQRPNVVAPCTVSTASGVSFPVSGGTLPLAVDRSAACGAITLRSSATWLTVSSTRVSATGKTQLTVRAANNTGAARTATITLAPASGTISPSSILFTQAAANVCQSLRISLSKTEFAAGGDSAAITVTATGTCAAPALRSSVSWMTVGTVTNGTALVTVAANATGSARTGQITASGAPVTVAGAPLAFRQLGAVTCSYSLSTQNLQFRASGGAMAITIRTNGNQCLSTIGALSTNAPDKSWVRPSVTSAAGTTTIQLTASAATQGRMGSLIIAGIKVNVEQAAGFPSNNCVCTSVACGANMQMGVSTSVFAVGAGSGTITLTTLNSCRWNLSNVPSWIELVDGPSGIGNGSIRFRVLPNTSGGTRTARITSPQATPDNSGRRAEVVIAQNSR